MGVGGSKKKSKKELESEREAAAFTAQLDRKFFNDHMEDRRVIKLLLLGAGESGKSTLFKQTIKLYGKGFDKQSMDGYLQIIYRNILQGMQTLVVNSDVLAGSDVKAPTRIGPEAKASKDFFVDLRIGELSDGLVTPTVANHIKQLWADSGVQLTFRLRSRFQLPDSVSYFFENIDRIAADGYSPSYDDILRCRSRTTGIVETAFQIKNDFFKIMDVGGQRSERKKWIHCFEDVTAVIFVAAINEYDQTLYEDNTTNRIREALELFDKTCNSNWFNSAAIILFLNKRDLFQEKIQTIDLKCCFPEYTGGCNYDAACEYMKKVFIDMNQQPNLTIYAHVTCATDTENVNFTFNAVKKIIIQASLRKSGLA